ncbi:Smr/MutS family protein [Methylobacterium sp. NEAU 140]|uniref:Smr/MutS family protein n=1 Tax=Methylobacterium sp. NEAU 140 TaxID=3064945 RepID=UPI0027343A2B|nr:Smr/MutS family protein [Methylobacterium sp. NEAU 140]MDP4026416.1 Smr/MutS family protein [Methylobacterium sp. NEAU 140]
MRPPRRPRTLTAGEARLWGEIARLITPLRGRARPAEVAVPPPAPRVMPDVGPPLALPAAPPTARTKAPKPQKPATDPARPATAAPYQAPPQRHAAPEGLERQARLGLRRGRLAVEARIDLHGMVQTEAHAALTGFLLRARAAGHAHVLVVTGKGGPGYADAFSERGVLRRSVPHWLRGPELRGIVLGFEEAARHHGGAGALYVRLRRR